MVRMVKMVKMVMMVMYRIDVKEKFNCSEGLVCLRRYEGGGL